MIDIHAHILAGTDDGARDLSVSLEMARLCARDGVHTLYCTSHYSGDESPWELWQERCEIRKDLQTRIAGEGIDLTLKAGAEWMLGADLPDIIREGGCLEGSRAFLFEIHPEFMTIDITHGFVAECCEDGFIPVLAHPERYPSLSMFSIRKELLPVVEAGGFLQVTAASLTGLFGRDIARKARAIAEAFPQAVVIASDAHESEWRVPGLSRAYEFLGKIRPELSEQIRSNLTALLAPTH